MSVLVLVSGLALLARCGSTAPSIDLEALRAEGRVLDGVPSGPRVWGARGPYPRGAEPFSWTGREAQVSVVAAGTILRPAERIVVGIRGASGRCTRFVIDTGSSISMLSTESALAGEAQVYARSEVVREDAEPGRLARLPRVRMGGLVGDGPIVALVPVPHDIDAPANILGLDLLGTLTLGRRDGRWTLRNHDASLPMEGARDVRLAARGLPVVVLHDVRGRPVNALIDTGAPRSLAVVPAEVETYRLADAAGRTVLEVRAEASIDWRGLEIGGRPIAVLLGLDVLSAMDFELDLAGGVWRLAPGPPH